MVGTRFSSFVTRTGHLWRCLMSRFPVNVHRQDPYRNFKFSVIVDGRSVPDILRVSPLTRRTESVISRSGGDPSQFRVAPGPSSFEPVTIERGLTHDPTFENWANLTFSAAGDAAMSLKDYRKDIQINLHNLQGSIVMSFRVYRCWVSEYQALPALDANEAALATERIVVQHEGWERDREVSEPAET